jgi:hypothetical protein
MVTAMMADGELDLVEAIRNQPIARLGEADEIAAAVLWLWTPLRFGGIAECGRCRATEVLGLQETADPVHHELSAIGCRPLDGRQPGFLTNSARQPPGRYGWRARAQPVRGSGERAGGAACSLVVK